MAESAPPPSPAFSGIDFNPAFFPSTTSDYLEFPVAQGTETFGTIFATTIDTPTPSADFDFLDSAIGNINIGTSVPTLKTIKLGQSTGSSIHCGSIDLQGTNINNAVASGTGTISIAPAQTEGTLNIGTHPTTGTRTTGGINIATNSVGVTPIIIGTTGQTTTTLRGTTVDVVTKLTTPSLDASLATTNMTIGSNLRGGNLTIGGSSGHTGTINIGSGQTTGALNIGNGARTGTATINIGTQAATSANMGINIGTTSNTYTNLYGTNVTAPTKLSTPILDCAADATSGNTSLAIGGSAVNGNIVIGAALGVGDISIATAQSSGGTVTIGSSNTATTLNGTSVKATTKLTTPIIDCVTDAAAGNTSLAIGGSAVNGNIVIGAALGVGDLSIGVNQSSGGTVTIGSSNTASTINGTISTTGLLTATGGLTLGSGQGITLSNSTYTPTSSQLGYYTSLSNTVAISVGTGGTSDVVQLTSIGVGVYSVNYIVTANAWSPASSSMYMDITAVASSGTINGMPTKVFLAGSATASGIGFSFQYKAIASSSLYIRAQTVGGTATIPVGYGIINLIRIA